MTAKECLDKGFPFTLGPYSFYPIPGETLRAYAHFEFRPFNPTLHSMRDYFHREVSDYLDTTEQSKDKVPEEIILVTTCPGIFITDYLDIIEESFIPKECDCGGKHVGSHSHWCSING